MNISGHRFPVNNELIASKVNTMTSQTYDLAVAYRIYPQVSKVPPVFSQDKYKLSEFCLKSFKNSLGDLRAKIIVLLDGCPQNMGSCLRNILRKKIWNS